MDFGEKIRAFARDHYGSLNKMADKLGMYQPDLSNYVNGHVKPGMDFFIKLQKIGCDINWLLLGENDTQTILELKKTAPTVRTRNRAITRVPLVNYVPAGYGRIDDIPSDDYFELPLDEDDLIALRVDGNSMERLFYDGDILFIQERNSQIPRKDGFTYVIEWEEHEKLMRAVKNVYREKDGFRLVSENKIHRDIYIDNIRRLYRIVGVFNREFRYQMNM